MCVLFPEGFSLSGGHDSLHQVVYVSDINPKSVAATEGHLQLLDIIHYVNGVSTQGMTLEEVKRALDMSVSSVVLKATRYCASVRGGCLRGHRHFRVLKDRKFSWKDIPELAMHRLKRAGVSKVCVFCCRTVRWLCQFHSLTPASPTVQSSLPTKVWHITMLKHGPCAECLRLQLRPVLTRRRDKNVLIGLGQSWPIARARTRSVSPEPQVQPLRHRLSHPLHSGPLHVTRNARGKFSFTY